MLPFLFRKTSYCVSIVLSKQILENGLRSTCSLHVQNLATVFSHCKRIRKQYTESLQDVIDSNEDKIEQFASIFKCDKKLIESLIRGDSRIVTSFNYKQVLEKFKILAKYKYSPVEIAMYPTLFCLRLEELAERLATVEPVRTICCPLSLMTSSKQYFERKVKEHTADHDVLNNRTKLNFVADKLECSLDDVYDLIEARNIHLLTRRPSVTNDIIDIVKENGFSVEEIRNYPSLLDLSVAETRRRFAVVKRCGALDKMSLGNILLSNRNKFQKSLRCTLSKIAHLEGYEDCSDILKKRLGISENDLEVLYARATNIKCFSARKLQTTLDVLLTEMNIHPQHVVRCPSVMYYSVKRLKMRHEILQCSGITDSWNLVVNLRLNETVFNERYMDIMLELEADGEDK